MLLDSKEILETVGMIQEQRLDIRTITLGISLLDCGDSKPSVVQRKVYDRVTKLAQNLVKTADEIEHRYGIPIVNKRVSVTPVALWAGAVPEHLLDIAVTLDEAAAVVGVDFLGGYSALVQKGMTDCDGALIASLPMALSSTERLCASVNVASTRSGINMDAINLLSQAILDTAAATGELDGVGCAKLVIFANMPEDNPFMAGATHGVGEGGAVVNVGISGPGVVRSVVAELPDADLFELAEAIKKTAFKITRVGELVLRQAAAGLGVAQGVVDLSLAPTPTEGDSVADILKAMGLENCGTHGSTAALAMLNDAVKKGGVFATSQAGGLSGAFIPVSEDLGMIEAARSGVLSIDKLEAMTSVSSVGLDMIAIPGNTPAETIAAIIADEMSIGVINNKPTAVRLIPVPGKTVGQTAKFGGLLGEAPILPVHAGSSAAFVRRGGRVPAPIQSFRG